MATRVVARKVFVRLGSNNGISALFQDDSGRDEKIPAEFWPEEYDLHRPDRRPNYVLGLDEDDEPVWETLLEVHKACGVEKPDKELAVA